MMFSKSNFLLCVLVFPLLTSQTSAHTISPHLKWHNHSSIARGHEDLTRLGISIANTALSSLSSKLMTFPEVPYGEAGASSQHPMIRGNFHTDFADEIMRKRYLPGSTADDDFGSHPALQHLHFLRNYANDKLWSAKKTCKEGKNLILNSTIYAFEHFSQTDQFLYWIGHVTHTIQDSFSPAHVVRTKENPRKIKEICTWGKRFDGVCYHDFVDIDDRIWSLQSGCLVGEGNRDFSCLKDEAKWAVHATAGYLIAVSQLADQYKKLKKYRIFNKKVWAKIVTIKLLKFFSDPTSPYTGHYQCPDN